MKRRAGRSGAIIALTAIIVLIVAPSTVAAAPGDGDSEPAPDVGPVRVVAAESEQLTTRAAALVAEMSSREKAAAVVMGHTPTTDAATLTDYMTRTGAAGFILMGANIPGDEAGVRAVAEALTVDDALPQLLAVDQEGGDVSRLAWDGFPSSLALTSEGPEATATAFAGRGSLVERAGIDVNFGIVADWTNDPGSFIYRRALGTSPGDAASRVAWAVAGEQPFASSTLKHFPGHGAAPGDSHSSIPESGMSLDQWRTSEALPFAAGIDAGAELVMFGHLAYTAVDAAPASLSTRWHEILRDELGFTGVAVTDDMGMLEASGLPQYSDPVANAVAAIVAGNDLVLGVGYSSVERANSVIDGIAAAVDSGAITAERIDEAATRVVALRLAHAGSIGALPCADCTPAG